MGSRWRNLGEDRRRLGATALALAVVLAAPATVTARSLPDGRAYELVTPVDKNGGDTGPVTSSPKGDRVAFYSPASFAGSPAATTLNAYVAERVRDGWITHPMLPPIAVPNLATAGVYRPADFNEDLSRSFAPSRAGTTAEPGVQNTFSVNLDGAVSWLTAPTIADATVADKQYAGRSADGSHFVFESAQQFDPQRTIAGQQIWELVGGHVRLVSILPDGSLEPNGTSVGSGPNGPISSGTTFSGTLPEPDAVSEDGSKIFFGLGTGVTNRVFVRIDGTETREITLSQRTGAVGQPATTASFVGASADGNVGVFSSSDQLTNDATPNGGLYAFDLRTNLLRFLSVGATDPNGAQVEGVSLVSRDGSRVYFVAQSVLVPGQGEAGGNNLYVSDTHGVTFIATLGNDDAQNWNEFFNGGARLTTAATADGRLFVFQSWSQLASIDPRGHEQIYLYDAGHDTIACVSCGPAGHEPGGDASILANPVPHNAFLPAPQLGRPRTFTTDGSRVFFQTTDQLVPDDVNSTEDVYEYWTGDGSVALISSGRGGYDSEVADNSPDGNDVFFTTRDSLVARDIDGGAKDIYDARVDGGFADPPEATSCSGDACRPAATPGPATPAPLTGVSTTTDPKKPRAPQIFVHRITAAGRKNVLKTGRLTLVTTVEAEGTVRATGTASYGSHTVYRLKSTSATLKAASTKNLHLTLPRPVRSLLRHHHRVKLAVTVSYNKADRPVRVALTLS